MFKTLAAALIAASMLTAPVLAQGADSSKPATEMTKVAKVHKHVRGRHHVKHVRHARYGHHHVRHVTHKRTDAVHVVRHASKIRAN